ncbi:TonB family protein [candidate division KSB1 bacterium]|nr:TonB family protein [candidate division KSB1 bacterium]
MIIHLLNDLGNYLVTSIINMSIGGSILLLVIMILSIIFRQKSASFHYFLWLIGLFPFILPQGIPLPTFFEKNIQSTIPMISFTPIQMTSVQSVLPNEVTWKAVLFICWGSVTLFLLCFLIIENKRFKRQISSLEPFHCDVQTMTKIEPDRIFISTTAVSPFTTGLIFPKIYLPLVAKSWSAQELNFVIQHELAHIRRRDLWIIPLQAIVQILFFFHPILWFLNRRINYFRELSCDDYAIATSDDSGVAYSKFLLKNYQFQNKFEFACLFSSCFGQRSSTLMKRFHYLLNRKEQSMKKISHFQKFVIFGVLILAVFLIGQNRTHGSPFRSLINPPLQESIQDTNAVNQPYDTPPEPVGNGYQAIEKNIKYPKEALKKEFDGAVVLDIFFDETGKPVQFKTIGISETIKSKKDGSISYRTQPTDKDYGTVAAAIEAIKKTQWNPARYQGKPVGVWFIMAISFKYPKELNQPPRIDVQYSRDLPRQSQAESQIFIAYDKPPEPIGGFEAIQQNLVYPELAKKAGIEGSVYLYVLVTETGQVEDVKVVKSLGLNNGLDEAAIDAVKKTPWTPAQQRGKPVKVWISIPVRFKIDKN